MVKLLPENKDDVHAIEISGQLTAQDVESMAPITNEMFSRFPRIKLLCVLTDFEGFTPQGDWAKTKWLFENMDKVNCMAIVGPEEDGHALAMAAATIAGRPIEVFPTGQKQQALEWLLSFAT